MKLFALPLLALTLIPFCGPKDMDRAEVNKVLFPGEGVVGGYDFGVSWDEVKANHNEVFEVRDEAGFEQLRRKVDDNAGTNGYFIGFKLDDQGKVESFSVSVNGQKQNAVTVREILDDFIAHFDATIGNGSCGPAGSGGGDTSCDWSAPGKPSVYIHYMQFDDPISGTIDMEISPPAAEE